MDVFGMGRIEARKFLSRYHFDDAGLRNATTFALCIEQCLEIPVWLKSNGALAIGAEVDEGFKGIVYQDKNNGALLIKKLRREAPRPSDNPDRISVDSSSDDEPEILTIEQRMDAAQKEAELFCRYYGQGTAEAISDGVDVYVRMLNIPGIPISGVVQFPPDALKKHADMLARLNDVGIMHGDLHGDNVLYDTVENRFYPIDFSDIKAEYLSASSEKRKEFDQTRERLLNSVIEQIERKTRH